MRVFSKLTVTLLALGCLTLPRQVLALELNVTDNGSNSSSEVAVSSQSNTSVTQNNSSQIENTTNTSSSTGGNEIANGQDSAIASGDSTTQTTIINNTGSNTQTAGCCDNANQSTATIDGNAEGTVNAINTHITVTQNFTGSNSTTIINNITGTASTGNNRIHNVDGSATITTGNASIKVSVSNVLNSNIISSTSSSDPLSVEISGNGESSSNIINSSMSRNSSMLSQNSATVSNVILADANTGGNSIENVGGTVSLLTGNASTIITISNTINKNEVVSSICCQTTDPEDPGPDDGIPAPTGGYSSPSQTSSSGGTGGVGGVGSVLSDSTGFVLPATGSNMSLWATIFNVFMLLFGLYLRRTAGRSPTK